MLLGAQQYTTVESAAALIIQDKIEGKHDENIHSVNGQYRNELYKRAENMVPQLDANNCKLVMQTAGNWFSPLAMQDAFCLVCWFSCSFVSEACACFGEWL